MNAIPQKAHNYQRVRVPQTPALQRTRPIAKIESLDAKRSAKLNAKRAQQAAVQQTRYYDDVEMYYAMKRHDQQSIDQYEARKEQYYRNLAAQKRQGQENAGPRQIKERQPGRKLTSAYEVKPRTYDNYLNNGYKIGAGGTLVKREAIPGIDMYADKGPEADARARYVAMENRAPKRKGVVSTILCIGLVFLMLSGILVKYAQLSNETYKNAQLEKQNAQLQEEKEKLEVEIALSQDLNDIQNRARALGMTHPTEAQIVRLPAGTLSADDIIQEQSALDEETGMPLAESEATSTVTDTVSGEVIGGQAANTVEQVKDSPGGFGGRVSEFMDSVAGFLK